jgi:hypothetical protein
MPRKGRSLYVDGQKREDAVETQPEILSALSNRIMAAPLKAMDSGVKE